MPGGLIALAMMTAAGQLSRFVQPRYLMGGALIAIGFGMARYTDLAPSADFWWFAWTRAVQMAPLPFLFLTITSYSYVGLPPEKSNQASSLINVARNLGGSFGVSMAQTLLAQREQFHQSRLVESLVPTSPVYRQTLSQAAAHFAQHGTGQIDAQRQAAAWIGQTLTDQAAYLAYIEVFAVLAVFAWVLTPIALLLRHVDLRAPRAGH